MRKWLLRLLTCILFVPLGTLSAQNLCTDGVLLFREDFGGNDPSDPEVISNVAAARAAVPGMSLNYTPCTSRTSGMSHGKFMLTKQGYQNGIGSSQWHLQDDHTHFGDLTRGYLLEVDGEGDNAAFYSTTIEGLCEGLKLSFTAYVANVMTWGMYVGRPGYYAYPRLKFVLTDPLTNAELATYDTGDIPFDSAFIGDNMCWQQSAEWRLIGMNFTVPSGQREVKLTIYNNTTGTTGNDFAIDDIEIRLCMTPDTIRTDTIVCDATSQILWRDSLYSIADTLRDTLRSFCGFDSIYYVLNVNTEPCEEPLCTDGTLLFREDFGGNSPDDPAVSLESVAGMSSSYNNSGNSLGSGNYTLRKEGWKNGIQWHRQDDHTYFNDKTRGYLLEVDGRGDAVPFYTKRIDGLCAGTKLTFSAYIVNVHYAGQVVWFNENGRGYVYPRMKFVLKDPTTGTELASQSTGDIQPDWSQDWVTARTNLTSAEWQLFGINFTVPAGVESIQMYIYNDVASNGPGNDFALDDIEIHLCLPPVTIAAEDTLCVDATAVMVAQFTNDGTLAEPLEYKWWYSADSVTWTEISGAVSDTLVLQAVQLADSGFYRVAVAGNGNIESVNCRAMSEPFRLTVQDCTPPESDSLCLDGVLLFREDFGGNDPNDPTISSASVQGMSSSYHRSDGYNMGSGTYMVTKKGFRNSSYPTYSLWHIQDDHTYPNDYTRGYFLEIDGRGDNQPFYNTTINNLCAGTTLTFSLYVVNVSTATQYVIYKNRGVAYAYPQLRLELTNPADGSVLATQVLDTVGYDWSLYNVSSSWQYSAQWQLMGTRFTVPEGVNAIKMTIYNSVTEYSGNDFALDDIEIRLCASPIRVVSPDTVCAGEPYLFQTEWEDNGVFGDTLTYRWWYSLDSANWTVKADSLPLRFVPQAADAGWYRVAVSAPGNLESPNCRVMSEPFRLTVSELTDSLTVASICGNETFTWYGQTFNRDTTIVDTLVNGVGCDSICTLRLTVRPRMYSDTTASLCRGDVLLWHGQRLTTDGVYRDTVVGSNGCDSVISLSLSLLEPTDSLTIASICDYETFTWYGRMFNRDTTIVDTLVNGVGCDSICTLRLTVRPRMYSDTSVTLCRGEVLLWHGQRLTTDGVYRDTVVGSNDCDSVITLHLSLLEPTGSLLKVEACDREAYLWNGRAFHRDTIVTDTLVNAVGCDSLSVLQLHMLSTLRTDTALTVCDTLLPITWHGQEIRRGGIYRDTLISRIACDSVVTLNVAVEVCYCDTLRAAATIGDVCADDDSLYIDLVYTDGLPAEYNVRFSSQAQQQGFPAEFGLPLTGHRNPLTLSAPIPHDPNDRQRYPRPDSYSVTLDVLDTCGVWRDWTLTFTVRYPSWLIVQKWDDVLALLNEDYNGGYVFSSIRWYHEGEAIASRGAHDSYIYEKPTLSFGEAYWVELTRADDGVTIPSCAVYPSLNRQGRERPASEEADWCRVYYIDGKQIAEYPLSTIHESLFRLPAGVYLLIYYNKEGELIDTEKRVQYYE